MKTLEQQAVQIVDQYDKDHWRLAPAVARGNLLRAIATALTSAARVQEGCECKQCDRLMHDNYSLCCEIARLEHELAIAVKAGHVLSTTRGPYATTLLSMDRPREEREAAREHRGGERRADNVNPIGYDPTRVTYGGTCPVVR